MKQLLLLITLITLLPTQSFSQCIVSHTGGDIGLVPGEWGQSFTSTCTGTIDYVGVVSFNAGVIPSDTLNIYDGSTTSGNLIYSHVFDSIIVANNGDLVSIDLIWGLPVAIGSQYTFEFNPGPITLRASQDYLDGEAFLNGVSASVDIDFEVGISALLGIEDLKQTTLSVHPNPTTNNVTISFEEVQDNFEVSLRNSLGQLLFIDKYTSTNQIELDLSSFPTGIYFLQFELDGRVITEKVIKK